MSAISPDEVAHLARLARLALSDAELDQFAGQLDSILTHVASIAEVDTSNIDEMANPAELSAVLRDDVAVPSLDAATALAGAPAVEQDRFAVPQILGEE